MGTLYQILLLTFAALGIAAILLMALRPNLFWAILILSSVLGTGVLVNGYGVVDEFFLICIVVGYLMLLSVRISRNQVISVDRTPFSKIHFQIFFLFMCYMVFQSFRGMAVLDDFRMIRFVVLFSTLALIACLIFKGVFPVPNPKQIVKIVLAGAIVHFSLYLGYGLLVELVGGMDRFYVQGQEWAGSTVSMFPLFCSVPAAYFVLGRNDGVAGKRLVPIWIAWLFLVVSIATSFYYDSRISWIFITVFLLISSKDLGVIKTATVFGVFAVFLFTVSLWILPGDSMLSQISAFYKALFAAGSGAQDSDIARKLEVLSSLGLVTDSVRTLFWGTGFYTERYSLIPYFVEVLSNYGVSTNIVDIIRPASFSSFLAGTGLVGIFFLVLCFFFTACEILFYTTKQGFKGRKVLLLSLVAVFGSMFISINVDLVLFYLCLMPSGLLVQLSKYETST